MLGVVEWIYWMGQQMYRCRCGTEFEDSEFSVIQECEDCRVAPYYNPLTDIPGYERLDDILARLAREHTTPTVTINGIYWGNIRINNTFTETVRYDTDPTYF